MTRSNVLGRADATSAVQPVVAVREPGRRFVRLAGVVLLVLVGGCMPASQPVDEAPWKTSAGASTVAITAAPDAGGPLSFRNCPTFDEARAAVPMLVSGPEANAVPFKTMLLQCSYGMDERDIQGRAAGVDILVFDASAEGVGLWDSVRTDPSRTNPTDLPGLGDRSFATGSNGQSELWVVRGDYGFHIIHTRREGIPLEELAALARAALSGLERAPR